MLKYTQTHSIYVGATKVDTCHFVIYINMSKRTNEIKEHRHICFMSVLPKVNVQRTYFIIDVLT
jgi:transcription elongation factor